MTLDTPKSILSSKAVQHLSPFKFFLGSPADRLDAIIKAVLVKPCSGFLVGHRVAALIRNCFLRQDGTLTSLVRAVKVGGSTVITIVVIILCLLSDKY